MVYNFLHDSHLTLSRQDVEDVCKAWLLHMGTLKATLALRISHSTPALA